MNISSDLNKIKNKSYMPEEEHEIELKDINLFFKNLKYHRSVFGFATNSFRIAFYSEDNKIIYSLWADPPWRIIEVTNQNPGNPWYAKKHVNTSQSGTKGVSSGDPTGGNPTKDMVFVLSVEEVCTLFGDSTARLKNKGFTPFGTQIKLDDPNIKDVISFLIIISDENDKNRTAENLAGKKNQ